MNTENQTPETESGPTGRATYEPESNRLRLYIGRVPREEYLKLTAEGWKALHKQREAGGGDFVALWTPTSVWLPLPAGTFRSEGTNVPTVLFLIQNN